MPERRVGGPPLMLEPEQMERNRASLWLAFLGGFLIDLAFVDTTTRRPRMEKEKTRHGFSALDPGDGGLFQER